MIESIDLERFISFWYGRSVNRGNRDLRESVFLMCVCVCASFCVPRSCSLCWCKEQDKAEKKMKVGHRTLTWRPAGSAFGTHWRFFAFTHMEHKYREIYVSCMLQVLFVSVAVMRTYIKYAWSIVILLFVPLHTSAWLWDMAIKSITRCTMRYIILSTHVNDNVYPVIVPLFIALFTKGFLFFLFCCCCCIAQAPKLLPYRTAWLFFLVSTAIFVSISNTSRDGGGGERFCLLRMSLTK